MSILELFCSVDDFGQTYAAQQPRQVTPPGKHRRRVGRMHPSEIMTILIAFHQSHYRTFKAYYLDHVAVQWRGEFPTLLSYNRFVELIPSVVSALAAYLQTQLGTCTGISFVDSTPLPVCKNPRIPSHKVFAGRAARGKTSTGWFYGFKLHLVISDHGAVLAYALTSGNVADRTPVPFLAQRLFGKLYGDKGYLSQPLFERLWYAYGVHLLTKVRKNRANALMEWTDKLLLRKRALIESVNDQLKNISQIDHSRHRSPTNFLANLLGGLIAYCRQPHKPSLPIDHNILWSL